MPAELAPTAAHHGGEGGGKRVCDDGTRRAPRENLNLRQGRGGSGARRRGAGSKAVKGEMHRQSAAAAELSGRCCHNAATAPQDRQLLNRAAEAAAAATERLQWTATKLAIE